MKKNKIDIFSIYEKFIYNIVQSKIKKIMVLVITFLLFLGSITMIPTELVLAKMLPGKNSNYFSVYVTLPEGSSKNDTLETSKCINKILLTEREIQDIEIFLGQGAPLDFAGLIKQSIFKNTQNLAEIVVNLSDKHNREEPSYLMVQRLRPELQNKCGTQGTNISMVEQPAGPPVLASIVAEIYGEKTEELKTISKKVGEIFRGIEGLVDVEELIDNEYLTYDIKINNIKASQSGISIEQINQILYLNFEGMSIGYVNSEKYNQQVPIFVRLSENTRYFENSSLEDIINKLTSVKLVNKKGQKVSLIALVDIKKSKSTPRIYSKNLNQVVKVLAETDMVSQVYPLIEAKKKIIETFNKEKYKVETMGLFDLNIVNKQTNEIYELKWDGEMKVTIDTFIELGGAFISALVLIFLLMVVYYKNFVFSGIVLLSSFLSIIGVIFGHFVMDLFTSDTFFLTATSLIGFIALIGISSRNSLLLIDFTKQLSKEHSCEKQAIAIAAATRAKPIFLTAGAIILASTLLAGDAVFGGLGVSLIFGTIFAVLASLFVVPVLLANSNLKKHFNS